MEHLVAFRDSTVYQSMKGKAPAEVFLHYRGHVREIE